MSIDNTVVTVSVSSDDLIGQSHPLQFLHCREAGHYRLADDSTVSYCANVSKSSGALNVDCVVNANNMNHAAVVAQSIARQASGVAVASASARSSSSVGE